MVVVDHYSDFIDMDELTSMASKVMIKVMKLNFSASAADHRQWSKLLIQRIYHNCCSGILQAPHITQKAMEGLS